jgi:uncharacterized phiE125 gp8 family phage protein
MWHSPVIVTPPADEPVLLDRAKEFLRIDMDDTAFDLEISTLIAGARSAIEKTTGTRMMTQIVDVAADCFSDLGRLPIGPVEEVVAISYVDAAGAEQTIAGERYETIGGGLEVGIRPTFDGFWPTPARRNGAVKVRLKVGYGDGDHTLPADLYVVLLQWIRGEFDDRPLDDETIASRVCNHRIWL